MEIKKTESTDNSSNPKQPYEAPKATFVRLQLEERLLSCAKFLGQGACASQSQNFS